MQLLLETGVVADSFSTSLKCRETSASLYATDNPENLSQGPGSNSFEMLTVKEDLANLPISVGG